MPPLLSLNAVVEIQSADVSRLVPVDQFILGNRSTVLSDKEMVVGIRIPKQFAAGYGAFMKLGARNYLVISIVAVIGSLLVSPAGPAGIVAGFGALTVVVDANH